MSQTEVNDVISKLKSLYYENLLPIEKQYMFGKFNSSEILESEMDSKPTILLIGQYSTGKTTFIRNLIGMDYPEMHIGPEPTTDRFIAVVHGNETKTIKGNALTGVTDLPYSGLSQFGSGFLNKFCAAVVPAPLLEQVNIIDTPGVLSGEKQRTSRGYDFAKVSKWFAERSDLILLMFDPSKLDISDEFKSVIEELRPYEDKVHCVLNKADMLDDESLMRVYGALLWSMGKIFRGAEVTRVYVGSFQNHSPSPSPSPSLSNTTTDTPNKNKGDNNATNITNTTTTTTTSSISTGGIRKEHEALFKKDREVLLSRLDDLPKACGMRKVNEMVKRIRNATFNVCLLGYLRSKMPYLWGQYYIQEQIIANLPHIFQEIKQLYDLSEGDFPNIEEYRSVLRLLDFRKFPKTNRDVLLSLRKMLNNDIPRIMSFIHRAGESSTINTMSSKDNLEDKDEIDTKIKKSDPRRGMLKKHNSVQLNFLEDNSTSLSPIWIILSITLAILAIFLGTIFFYTTLNEEFKVQYMSSTMIQILDNLSHPIVHICNRLSQMMDQIFSPSTITTTTTTPSPPATTTTNSSI